MTPRLKFALIALFIILDAGIVVYFFTDTFSPPAKQTAVQPPVSTPPVVQQLSTQSATPPPAPQPPPQMPVSQPPAQPPAPTPQQIAEAQRQAALQAEQTRQLTECNQKQSEYTKLFLQDAPARLQQIYIQYNSLHDPSPAANALGELIQQMRNRRASWEVEKRRCLQIPNWGLVLSDSDVSRVLREDCLQRSKNYARFFEQMQNMSDSQKERFLAASSPKEPPYRQFVSNWEALDRQCSQDITGWTTPPETRAAYQRQASTPR
jgi:type IV secretory pathway VirB10-like protein